MSAIELGCGSVRYGTVCGLVGDLHRRDLGSYQGNGRVAHGGSDGTGTVCCLCWPAEIFSGWLVRWSIFSHLTAPDCVSCLPDYAVSH